MKKLISLVLVVASSFSLYGYNHRINFNESAQKGGKFRITANVVAWGADTKEVTPSDTPFDFGTFAANCVDQFEITVVGGEYDGTYLKAGLPVYLHCMNHNLRIAKTGEMAPGRFPLYKSTNGALELEITP